MLAEGDNALGPIPFLVGCVFIGMGLLVVISPYAGWWLSTGWKLKNAEPSDLALVMNRVGGVVTIIMGIVVMFAMK